MPSETVTITLSDREKISASLSLPDKKTSKIRPQGIVIAHGAANDMDTPLIRAVAQGLSQKGFACMRFNFLYRELGKKSVDPEHRLVLAWQKAITAFKEMAAPQKTIAMGKSLGARIAAQASAAGEIDPDALVFLGFPLHAPGKKERLRDQALVQARVPMLFFQGTRDPFCDLSLLAGVLKKVTSPVSLTRIAQGNHSFDLPKSHAGSPSETHARIVETCETWIEETL